MKLNYKIIYTYKKDILGLKTLYYNKIKKTNNLIQSPVLLYSEIINPKIQLQIII